MNIKNISLQDSRSITMLVDSEKNVVIFPYSQTKEPVKLPHGTVERTWNTAYFPIELKYPYSNVDLAQKIEYGIEQWNKHECYKNFSGRNTFEEKYYGVKGFKNAVKGVKHFSIGWNEISGKYIYVSLPFKRGYTYFGVGRTFLPSDADWIDFANEVIKFINMDYSEFGAFKTYKNRFNI